MNYAIYGILIVSGLGVAYVVLRSPAFWLGMAKELFLAMLPGIMKAIAPKDMTKDEKGRIDRAQEPGLAGQNTRNNDGMHHK